MELPENQQICPKELIAILTATANEISRIEVTAKAMLYENNDRQGYHEHLRQILQCE